MDLTRAIEIVEQLRLGTDTTAQVQALAVIVNELCTQNTILTSLLAAHLSMSSPAPAPAPAPVVVN